MTLPASGPLAMTDIQTEFGGTNPIGLNEYYAGGGLVPAGTSGTYGAVPSSGALSVQNFYGTSNYIPVYIEELFQTWLYTGNGSTQTITNGIDLAGEGGLVWLKGRSNASSHAVYDTVRGAPLALRPNGTQAQFSQPTGLTVFNNNGFSFAGGNTEANYSGWTYSSWTFRKQPKFFDVVTWSGDGTGNGRRLAHNLGSVPGCMIFKRTNITSNWSVWHRTFSNPTDDYLNLNLTNGIASFTNNWGTSAPTATDFPAGYANGSGDTYVAYLFAHNAGGFGLTGTDNVISCGSIVASGGANDINLGFEAQFILLKKSNGIDDWYIYDTMRGMPVNNSGAPALEPNLSAAEANQLSVWPTATGFATNGLSGTYIYIAIRRGPMRTPTTGTSVYQADISNGSNPEYVAGFPIDMSITGYKTGGTAWYPSLGSRLLQGTYLQTTNTSAQDASSQFMFDYQDSWYDGSQTSGAFVSWMFRRAPGFFDEVCYTGTSSAHAESHNLGVIPELTIIKPRNAVQQWEVYAQSGASNFYGVLNENYAFGTEAYPSRGFQSAPSATQLNLSASYLSNYSGYTYVAYLFASCPGVSKVGSFTGTGATQVINCGFTGGARFVLIKATSTTGNWLVWDSARGIVAGNDPYLTLNTTAAEVTSTDWVDTAASGFELSNAGGNLANSNGVTYIFLAIA